jgi:acetylornithine deacetylase
MTLDLVNTLSDLVSLPSVNPMGRDLSGPEFLEHRVTDYLQALFKRLGLPYERQTVEPQRDNIVARLDGDLPLDQPGAVIMFEAHQDTVPVDGMTIEPWTPVVDGGRITGRGSCDIKGGMTAMLGALARLAEERPSGMPTIIMACSVNEEHGFSGAQAICELWKNDHQGVFPRRPDVAIIAEPTELDIVVAHKGVIRWQCRTLGRACHSSQPQRGENAIFTMRHVLAALETFQKDVAPSLGQHRLCEHPTLSVGMVRGGISVNTVPDECVIDIDRRLLPGEDPEAARQRVIEYIANHAGLPAEKIVHDPPYIAAPGLADEGNDAVAEKLRGAANEVTGSAQIVGVPFGTDAAAFAAAGVPSVVFGPGCIDQAHTADEWLDLEQLERASEILYRFASGGLL